MLLPFETHAPALGDDVFVAQTATVIGKVTLGAGASIWYGTVVRGDVGRITIGARTNVQDLSLVHVTGGKFDTHLGDDVTVGHRVTLHGCTIANHVLVGMGAIIMDDVSIGAFSLVGAGALLTPGKKFAPHSVLMGAPARLVRQTTEAEVAEIKASALRYVALARQHHALG